MVKRYSEKIGAHYGKPNKMSGCTSHRIDASVQEQFQWIFRGNIVVPTGNPFLAPNVESSDAAIQWVGPGLKLLMDHVVTVNMTGIIQHVLPYDLFLKEHNVGDIRDLSGSGTSNVVILSSNEFLCPGMIDLHIHAPQFAYSGTATDRPLMGQTGWLETYTFPAERRLRDDLSHANQVYSSVVQATLRNGTTTAVYFATLDVEPCKILVDCALRYGQRAFIGKVCMDRNSPIDYCQSIKQNLNETEELIQYINSQSIHPDSSNMEMLHTKKLPLILPIIAPRFIPTCTPALLTELGKLATKHNCHISSHMSESIDEVAFSRYLDQEVDNKGTHTNYVERTDAMIFDSHGLLTNQCIMAHGVHVTDGDLNLLRNRGTAIAHCPLSNFFFAGSVLPCRHLMECKNRVGLGTDVAGGYHCSMFHSSRMAVVASQALHQQRQMSQNYDTALRDEGPQKSNVLDYRHAFYLATLGGAEALNLSDRIGTITPGLEFDALILSASIDDATSSVQIFKHDTITDMFQKIIVLGDDRNVKRVFVQGNDVTAPR